jgi:hypothetical protein
MNRQDFTVYIHHPQRLDWGVRDDLRNLAERYPYCSSIQVLYTLLLLAGNDHEFNLQLKKSAAYATSRKKLKDLIDAFQIPAVLVPIPQKPIPATEPGPVPVDEISDPSSILHPLSPITKATPSSIQHPLTNSEQPETPLSKEAIIEKFIRGKPRISAPRATFFTPSESAIRSNTDDAVIVSETLARLYFEQGNIAKAIQVYNKLSLLFPEKSSYFAAQIKKLG